MEFMLGIIAVLVLLEGAILKARLSSGFEQIHQTLKEIRSDLYEQKLELRGIQSELNVIFLKLN